MVTKPLCLLVVFVAEDVAVSVAGAVEGGVEVVGESGAVAVGGVGGVGGGCGSVSRWRARSYAHLG